MKVTGENSDDIEVPKMTLMQAARLKILAKNPHLIRNLFSNGTAEPSACASSSPLIDLLSRIEKADRGMIWDVRLNPDLGYDQNRVFSTANELLKYLTAAPSDDPSHAEKYRITEFERSIPLEELLVCSRKYPSTLRMMDGEAKIRRIGARVEVKYRARSTFTGPAIVDTALLANIHPSKNIQKRR